MIETKLLNKLQKSVNKNNKFKDWEINMLNWCIDKANDRNSRKKSKKWRKSTINRSNKKGRKSNFNSLPENNFSKTNKSWKEQSKELDSRNKVITTITMRLPNISRNSKTSKNCATWETKDQNRTSIIKTKRFSNSKFKDSMERLKNIRVPEKILQESSSNRENI